MKRLKAGDKILIEATVVRQAMDSGREEKSKGYVVKTERTGVVYVNPDEIYSPRK